MYLTLVGSKVVPHACCKALRILYISSWCFSNNALPDTLQTNSSFCSSWSQSYCLNPLQRQNESSSQLAMPESVLITGCSGGLGEALAREFKLKGLRVFASARVLSKIEHLQDEGIETIQLDVVSETSIRIAFAEINTKAGGKLHYLVNNSGIGGSLYDSVSQNHLLTLNIQVTPCQCLIQTSPLQSKSSMSTCSASSL